MIRSSEVTQTEDWVGRTLLCKKDIEDVWKEYDHVRKGERIFCKDKNGRVLEITGGEDSPLHPYVKFTEWINFGKGNEDANDDKLVIPEFLALKPVIIDPDKELEAQG